MKVDKHIAPLCKVMESLPGISIHESCDGHGKTPPVVYFAVEECQQAGLFIFARCVDRRYWAHGNSWSLTVSVHDEPRWPLPIIYTFTSKRVVGESAWKQLRSLVENIESHLQDPVFMDGYDLRD